MKLQTQIPLSIANHQIDYDSRLVLLGSCFSENIGAKFNYFKFRSFQNPFGVLFHPLAIEKLIEKSVTQEEYSEDDIFFFNERWLCFDAHSDLNDSSKENLLNTLKNALKHTHQQLKQATHIFITLGTSWVYKKKDRDIIVANCHKVPQKEFSKEILSVQEITASLKNTIELIRKVNRTAQIVFTVSPVRHIKDGFTNNQRSKAHLMTAIQSILHHHNKEGLDYFPSYEIMMDELRDYRFYASDMVHPNELAIDYIWEKFKCTWIQENVHAVMSKVETIQKGLGHKPFHPDSIEHQNFLKSLREKIKKIQKDFPQIIFEHSMDF
ncbi:GSCFA domain-containing protein [Costertonia aggregata]|uniref:GSCFA domain-containing protein n=1 Tax=Costertonia aggregata TaxID=343403 RepID=A0A7H9AR30_9FLAO|nr:GSCFA domain-containing protein [Costertonia aggregata]QLG45882.1 GSCFA domain-containing protein [Costertonia aggregata]